MMSSTCTAATQNRIHKGPSTQISFSHTYTKLVNDPQHVHSGLDYSQRPSSVRSTLMMKNMNPRAPSFCPPTSVFTQPSKQLQQFPVSHELFWLELLWKFLMSLIRRPGHECISELVKSVVMRGGSASYDWITNPNVILYVRPLDLSSESKLPGPSWPIRWPR